MVSGAHPPGCGGDVPSLTIPLWVWPRIPSHVHVAQGILGERGRVARADPGVRRRCHWAGGGICVSLFPDPRSLSPTTLPALPPQPSPSAQALVKRTGPKVGNSSTNPASSPHHSGECWVPQSSHLHSGSSTGLALRGCRHNETR